MKVKKAPFGKTQDGKEISIYYLSNTSGMMVGITDLGCAIVSISTQDRSGNFEDVVLGYDSGNEYESQIAYFGVVLGRYANRIRKGRFILNDKEYQLSINSTTHHAHGGVEGFSKKLWDAEISDEGLILNYISEDGEEGYPGKLNIKTIYSLSDDNKLLVNYQAQSDKDTIINISNHSYINLAGHMQQNACDQFLKIYSHYYTECDNERIPNGKISNVDGTPFDFLEFTRISDRIDTDCSELRNSYGYDLNYILEKGNKLNIAAELYDESSGRILKIYTTMPGLQFYSGNGFPYPIRGKKGVYYQDRSGICLETQFYPNSVEYRHFPSTILRANEVYDHKTIFEFGICDI